MCHCYWKQGNRDCLFVLASFYAKFQRRLFRSDGVEKPGQIRSVLLNPIQEKSSLGDIVRGGAKCTCFASGAVVDCGDFAAGGVVGAAATIGTAAFAFAAAAAGFFLMVFFTYFLRLLIFTFE